jgi:hypothetical protein
LKEKFKWAGAHLSTGRNSYEHAPGHLAHTRPPNGRVASHHPSQPSPLKLPTSNNSSTLCCAAGREARRQPEPLTTAILHPSQRVHEHCTGLLSLTDPKTTADDPPSAPPPDFPLPPSSSLSPDRSSELPPCRSGVVVAPLPQSLTAGRATDAPMGMKSRVLWPWAGLNAIVDLALFNSDVCQLPFDLFWIIQIKFKSSENCSNSNNFDKNMNSILLFEFKHILWNKNIINIFISF